MARTCNCGYPVWGTDKNTGIGYCAKHQYLRTDKKPKKIPVRTQRTSVRENLFPFDNQVEMFSYLWENAKNEKGRIVCKYTGEEIHFYTTLERWLCNFAHILNKKNYPYFKLNPENIEIVRPEFHRIVDAGTQKERAEHPTWRFDLWDARVIAMKEEYQKFKKQNLLA